MGGMTKGEREKAIIKEIIKKLHAGADPEVLKDELKEVLSALGAADIATIEEELIREGMPREEIQRLCDLHLRLFAEAIGKEGLEVPPGHPLHTLMQEHRILLQFSHLLITTAEAISAAANYPAILGEKERLRHIVEHLRDSEKHYLREENVLFPYLEKHGITGPPAVMWAEHNEIRTIKKGIYTIVEGDKYLPFGDFSKGLSDHARSLDEMLKAHFYKEDNILFPTALKAIPEEEWGEIAAQFAEIGYCCFTPQSAKISAGDSKEGAPEPAATMEVALPTGGFSKRELEALLNTLPVDITFVDKNDTVRYFSQSQERIFPRTKAVIGRKVQLCHPKQSLQKVEQILNEFKENKRDVAEFWINLKGRLIYIRYFALRSAGEYLGTIEVTQDITDIKKIEGEKRLL